MHPIDTYDECKIAQMHEKYAYANDMFKGIEYYMNIIYDEGGVDVVSIDTKVSGCIYHNNNVIFNINSKDKIEPDSNSLVKILKLDRDMGYSYQSVNNVNKNTPYLRFLNRRIGEKELPLNGSGFHEEADCTKQKGTWDGACSIASIEDEKTCTSIVL